MILGSHNLKEPKSSIRWRHPVLSFDLLASFASAARHGSLAKAARELGLTPSAVAKNIARLELHAGVRLFYRTTRHVTLSPDGARVCPLSAHPR
ncbi:MAG: LysR family transcriptional regulator [Thiohalocapsa sp.]|nr:LysR family transcriptional regulator [Thiohalocapsa sp.]